MSNTQTSRDDRQWPDGQGPLRSDAASEISEELIIDVDGFEGPLDLLLELARQHRIDLAQISILTLANQYLDFIERAQHMRLDLAADYLVMAAWLAYLKSRLLIPQPQTTDESGAEDMVARLAFRLQRLQGMRDASVKIMQRPQLGRDVHCRGAPQALVIDVTREYGDNLIDLLRAYTDRRRQKAVRQTYTIKRQATWSIKEAREALEALVGGMDEWGAFDMWLEHYLATTESRRSVRASSFTASLELARDGRIEMRQDEAFQPIYLRRRNVTAEAG